MEDHGWNVKLEKRRRHGSHCAEWNDPGIRSWDWAWKPQTPMVAAFEDETEQNFGSPVG